MIASKEKSSPYSGLEQKTFHTALANLLTGDFGISCGRIVLNHLCTAIEKLVESFYPLHTRLKMGQMLWSAVHETERPSYGKRIQDCKIVPVVLTLVNSDDIKALKNNSKAHELHACVIKRLCEEAQQQHGVLTEADLRAITKLSLSHISSLIRKYESRTDSVIPRRGTVHDMGRSLTHKRIVCYKYFVQRYSTPRIARETNHSLADVEKYIHDYKRVKYCMLKKMEDAEIAVILKMSNSLVKEYIQLISSLGDSKISRNLDNDLLDIKLNSSI